MRPSRDALARSKARLFVGQLEPYVTEMDLFPVFSCYGRVLHVNVVRHSTTVTPNELRRIPTAFVWYETVEEADAAIAALHNQFSFSPEDSEGKRRCIQVSYADKSPEVTKWGVWQKKTAEATRKLGGGPSASPQASGASFAYTSSSPGAEAAHRRRRKRRSLTRVWQARQLRDLYDALVEESHAGVSVCG